MAVCQKCGAENTPEANVCHSCGATLARRSHLARTMVGMPSPVVAPPSPEQEPTPTAAQPPAHRQNLGATMLGMPSPVARPSARAAEPPTPDASAPSETARPRNLGGTMLGMPSPIVQPGQQAKSGASAPKPEPADATPMQKNPRFAGTLLGIAHPGIAPRDVGESKPPTDATPREAPAPRATPALPPAMDAERIAPRRFSSRPPIRRIPTTRSPWRNVALIGGGMVIAGAVGGLVAVLAPKPITVVVSEFSIDEDGNDHLRLRCAGCDDGDTLFLGSAKAKVSGAVAELVPKEPLALGRNELIFRLVTAEGEKKDAKPVILPVAFRVLTSWEGRHGFPPHAVVTVAAPNGTKVTIDGQPTPVENQKAIRKVTFEKEATGESKTTETVSAAIPVVVSIDGKARKAEAQLKGRVTPLTLRSPAPVHRLGGKPLTIEGTTSPGAQVSIGETKVTADGDGHFHTVVTPSEAGPLLVEARGERLLARRAIIRLVKDTKPEPDAKTSFAAIAPGVDVAVRGNVLESRIADGTTRTLIEVESGCDAPPCLLRAVYGEPLQLPPNRGVFLTGRAAGGSPLTVRATSFK